MEAVAGAAKDTLMNRLALTICAGVLMAPSTQAQTLQIRGVAGYLGEYALSADVSPQSVDSEPGELSGPLTVRHVGLCTHAGPNEMAGRLKLRFLASAREVEASLSYEGRECAFRGVLSESETGFMTCNDKLTLPVKLWTNAHPESRSD